MVGPAHAVGPPGRASRGRRGLDEVQERGAVAAQQHQRRQPPRAGGRRTGHPPTSQCSAARPAPRGSHEQRREGQHGECARGVHSTHAQHRHRRPQPGLACTQATGAEGQQRQHGPRQQGTGEHLPGQHADRAQQSRGQRVGEARDDPRFRTHSERPRDVAGALVGEHEQQRPPQPLNHPAGQPEDVTGEEERAVRKEVAVGLVLRLTEREVAVPQVGGPGEESQGIGRQVELGVRGTSGPAAAAAIPPPATARSTARGRTPTTMRWCPPH